LQHFRPASFRPSSPHDIGTPWRRYGRASAKPVGRLLEELRSGACHLEEEGGTLRRVVEARRED
jgi:hypothetical protein